MNVLEFQEVSRVYGRGHTATWALRDLSLTVAPGEFLAVTGASGSGKSTLLNLAAGLDQPDSGRILLLGRDLRGLDETRMALLRRQHVGIVFQALNLVPTLTAAENISLPLCLLGQHRQAAERARHLLALAGLSAHGEAFPEVLSGGEQQRVAVLRAVAHRPELVLMDEPTSSLDTGNSLVLLELLQRLNREEGAALVLATHDERVAAKAGRQVRLRDGRVLADGQGQWGSG
jgi:putative ABC transport system ATP-binding protein